LSKLFVKTSGVGESLIVLHGWGMNSVVWDTVRPALESQYKVSWIDLPGHGENVDVLANSLDEIVDLILPEIPEGSHLLGWSLGGLIIQAIAQQIPDKIKSMTLVASTPRFSEANDWPYAMSQDVLNNFAENLKIDIEGTLKRFIALQFMGIKDAKPIQRELTDKVLRSLKNIKNRGGVSNNNHINTQVQALILGLQIITQSDFREQSHKIPQHWLLAERDRLIPKEVINDLKLIRPDAQITLLENAGHAPFMTHPEEFVASVTPFINKYAG